MAATGEGTAGGALPTLGIVGVTGAVGRVVLDVLPTRHSHWSRVRLAAGAEDVGSTLRVGGEDVVIEALTPEFFDGIDVAIFDIPPSIAREWVELAAARGVVAIDNSTEFRTEPDVPLVVPEVNPRKVADRPRGIIANPGATVMTMIDALAVLHGVWELTGLVVTTFQAASGLGRTGMTRLHDELDVVHGHRELGTRPGDVRRLIEEELGESPFPAPLALNVVPFVGHHVGDGLDLRGGQGARRDPQDPRHPRPADLGHLRAGARRLVALGHHPRHVRPAGAAWPTPARRSSRRPRSSCSTTPTSRSSPPPTTSSAPTRASPAGCARRRSRPHTLDLFICGDNLRKGAALNMVQTAELVARELGAGRPDGGRVTRPGGRRATMDAVGSAAVPPRRPCPAPPPPRPPHRRSAP